MIPNSLDSRLTQGVLAVGADAHRMAMRIIMAGALCVLPMAALWAAPDSAGRAEVGAAAGGPPAGVPGNSNAGGNGNGNGNGNTPAANQSPIAVDDYVSLAAPTSITIPVLDNDSDPDGDRLTISSARVVFGNGTVVLANRDTQIRYTPVVGFVGTAQLKYTISDGRDDTASASVFVTIANRPPGAFDGTAAVNEDRSINLTLQARDPDRHALVYAIVSGPTQGTLGPAIGNRVLYTPAPDYYGPDSIAFVANDGFDDSNVGTIVITVRPINDQPVAVDDVATTTMSTSVVIPVLENDYDIDSPTLTITGARTSRNGTAVISGDTIIYTPRSDWTGIDTFRYTITDGLLSATAIVTVTVEPAPIPVAVTFSGMDAMWDATPKPVQVITEPTDIAVAVTYDGLAEAPSAPGTYEVTATVTEPGYVGSASTMLTIALGGSGLAAVYHNDLVLGSSPVSRVDPVIDFNWGSGSPDPAMGVDHFSVLWTGKVQAATSEVYTFITTSDDGVRVWVDGTLIIDHWRDQAATDRSGSIALEAGQLYDIAIQYYENRGQAVMRLSWETPTSTRQIVPTGFLFPSLGGVPVPVVGEGSGLAGFYFPTMTLTGSPVLRQDATIDFNWGNGQPHPDIPVDLFSVRWVGYVQAQFTQTYVFTTTTDDGVRLWVDNQLIVDQWVDQAATTVSGSISLVAGQIYPIRMEFYERDGQAVTHLGWSGPATLPQIIPQSQLYPNIAPVAVDDVAMTDEDVPALIDVLANDSDADGDPLNLVAVSVPAHGTAAMVGNQVLYSPATDWFGIDSFTYTISDGFFQATATVTVTVTEVSLPAAVQIGDLAQVWDGTPRSIQVTTDPIGLPVVVTYTGAVDAPLYAGTYVVEATIDHPDYHGSASATLVVAPTVTIIAPAYAIAEREPVTVTATLNGQLGGSVTWQWVHLAGPGTVTLTSADSAAPSVIFASEGLHTLYVHADVGYAAVTAAIDLTVAEPDVDTGLLAHYAFDEGEGHLVYDSSGTNWTGTVVGSASRASGKLNGAIQLEGTGYVEVRPSRGLVQGGSPITISGWIKPDRPFADMTHPWPLIAYQGSLMEQRGFGLMTLKEGTSQWGMRLHVAGASDGREEVAIIEEVAGQWIHFAGVYDGEDMVLYRNGIEVTRRTVGALNWLGNPNASLVLGVGLEGLLDDVRIYTRALDRVDIFGLAQTDSNHVAPLVDAGEDHMIDLSASTITLAGIAVPPSPGASIVGVNWTQLSGPTSVTFADAQAMQTAVTFHQSGVYHLRLTADDGALLAWDDVRIEVAAAAIDLSAGLLAWYTGDEGAGSAVTDISGQGNHGTWVGPAWSTDGLGGALRFTGGNYVYVPPSTSLNSDHLTIAIRLRLDRTLATMTSASPMGVFRASHGANQGFGLLSLVHRSNHLGLRVYNGSGRDEVSYPEPTAGMWVELVGTFDGSVLRWYRDGRLINETAASGPAVSPTTRPMTLGAGLEGLMDEIRIYDRALSPGEVLLLHQNHVQAPSGNG